MAGVLNKIKISLGVVLLVVGALGVLLPVVPGAPIILAGFTLLGSNHPVTKTLAARVQRWRARREAERRTGL